MRPRTRVTATVGVAVCMLVSLGGIAASTFVKSPTQAAADTQPPPRATLFATVERRVLTDTLVTRGTVTASVTVSATPTPSGQGEASAVVTAVRTAVGRTVRPGSVLLEVSGRPLIALPGTVPAYRDLRPGDDGTDIGQLQAALRSLGYYHGGDSAGHFGPGTKRAVTRLYAATDYDLATTGGHADGGDRAALQNAQDAVDAAQRAVDDLNRVIGGGQAVAPSPSAGASEPLPVQLRYLRRALTRARNAQADLIGRTGPMVPRAEIVFVSSFPAQVSQLAATVGAAPAAPLITLAAGALHVVAKLPPDQGRVLRSGMAVAISSEVVGSDVTGTITAVGPITSDEQPAPDSTQAGPATETGGQPGRPYVRVVAAPRSRLGPAWFGQDVRLTVTSARTADPVLVVPLSAVSAGADGRTTVSKISPGGAVSRIEVRAGMSGGGFVEITPISHPLVAGDRVLVGT